MKPEKKELKKRLANAGISNTPNGQAMLEQFYAELDKEARRKKNISTIGSGLPSGRLIAPETNSEDTE